MQTKFWSINSAEELQVKDKKHALKNWGKIRVVLSEGGEKTECYLSELGEHLPEDITVYERNGHKAWIILHRIINHLANSLYTVETMDTDNPNKAFKNSQPDFPSIDSSEEHEEVEKLWIEVDVDRMREIQEEVQEADLSEVRWFKN